MTSTNQQSSGECQECARLERAWQREREQHKVSKEALEFTADALKQALGENKKLRESLRRIGNCRGTSHHLSIAIEMGMKLLEP